MNNIKVPTSLDTATIKQSLKDFLKTQSEFNSYDFEGSGMSVILDLLTQHYGYNSFLANMVLNEMDLDTAQTRSMIVSHAKRLSYVPHSKTSATAVVDITVTPTEDTPPSSIVLEKGSRFSATIDDILLYFISHETRLASLVNSVYVFNDVILKQGKELEIEYVVSSTRQRFEIPNKDVDINSMNITVQTSTTDTLRAVYQRAENIIDVNGQDNMYFISEGANGRYSIEFGDGVLGKEVVAGNIVNIKYLTTKGADGNKANKFDSVTSIANFSNVVLTTEQSSYGGSDRESNESIQFIAPKQFLSQNRAVIDADFIPIVKRVLPGAEDVIAWGGQKNLPPKYGSVFIGIKMPEGVFLTQATKDDIAKNQIRPLCVTTITPIIVDADSVDINIELTVVFNRNLLGVSTADLVDNVRDVVLAYSDSDLRKFGKRFRSSKLTNNIDKSTDAITNTFINAMSLSKQVSAVDGAVQNLTVQFGENQVKTNSVKLTGFRVADFTSTVNFGNVYYARDNSLGLMNIYRDNLGAEVLIEEGAGTVNYDTGLVTLNNFSPLSSESKMTIVAQPKFFDIEAIRGEILKIVDKSDVIVNLEAD